MDALEDPSSSLQLVLAAMQELERSDLWMRTYALPSVLELLRREDMEQDKASSLFPYFQNIQNTLRDDIKDSFHVLVQALLEGTAVKTAVFENCVDSLQLLPDRSPSQIPYRDLHEFLPENYLLAVYFALVLRDRGTYAPIISGSESKLGHLIAESLKGKHGRLAYILAMEIRSVAGTQEQRQRIVSQFWNQSGAALEPDMLALFARLYFFGDRSLVQSEPQRLVEKLIEESVMLAALRPHVNVEDTPSTWLFSDRRRVSKPIREGLAIVFWQLTLWELAASVHSELTAQRISQLWRPRWGNPVFPLTVSGPFQNENARAHWKVHLETQLAFNHPPDRNSQESALKDPEFSRRPEFSVGLSAIVSPWLVLKKFSTTAYLLYPAVVHSEPALIRLLGSIIVAARLLRRLGGGGPIPSH